MKKGIIFIRNSDFYFDTRLRKAVNVALEAGFSCIVLDWLRNGEKGGISTSVMQAGSVEVHSYGSVTPFGRGLRNIKGGLKFSAWLKKTLVALSNRYSIIYACDYDVGRTAYRVAKMQNKRLVYDIFDYYSETHALPKPLKRMVKTAENRLIDRADAVIICHESRFHQIENCHPKRCEVIYNTPAYDDTILEMDNLIKMPSKCFKIVYVGALAKEGRLLREILNAMPNRNDLEFHIAGAGAGKEEIEQAAQKFDNVFYYGILDNRNALKLSSECDLLFAVYEQTVENNKYSAPNKVYEAMALGKPIIACCGCYIDAMIRDNQTGITVSYDVNEFFKAVDDIKTNPDLQQKLSNNAKNLYKEKYTWEIMSDKLKSLYCDLMECD